MVKMLTKTKKSILGVAAAVILLACLPVIYGQDRYVMNVIILCFVWSIVAASWDLILGYARVFSFGQIAFFTIGGYVSGLLAIYAGLSPWLGMLAGGLVSAFLGVLIGIPCLRLQGMYLAIVTFAVHLVVPTLVVWAGPGRFATVSTGGTFGLQRIPVFNLFGPLSRSNLVPWYYLAMAVFVVFAFIIYRVIHSPVGLAFMALRDAEGLAKSLGVDDYKYKLIVFGLSAFIAGVMGAFYAHYFGIISPAVMSLDVFLLVLTMVLFGGLGVFPGAILGSFTITIVNELLRPLLVWRLVVLGAIVVVTMTYMPKGLMSVPEAFGQMVCRLSRTRATAKGWVDNE